MLDWNKSVCGFMPWLFSVDNVWGKLCHPTAWGEACRSRCAHTEPSSPRRNSGSAAAGGKNIRCKSSGKKKCSNSQGPHNGLIYEISHCKFWGDLKISGSVEPTGTYLGCYKEVLGCCLFTGGADHDVKDSSLVYRIHSLPNKVRTQLRKQMEIKIFVTETKLQFWWVQNPRARRPASVAPSGCDVVTWLISSTTLKGQRLSSCSDMR